MKVCTVSTGDLLFLELQLKSLRKYMTEDYEFIVFNACVRRPDFSNNGNEKAFYELQNFCFSNHITFLNLIEEEKQTDYDNLYYSPSNRHGFVLERVMEYMKQNPDEYFMIDSDMFLIDYLDMKKYRGSNSAIVLQQRGDTKYFWGNLFYFNIPKMKNLELLKDFKAGIFNNVICDDCGDTYRWVHSHPNIPESNDIRNNEYDKYNTEDIKFIKHLISCTWDRTDFPSNLDEKIMKYCEEDIRNVDNKCFCEIYDKTFLHYRAGSNWTGFHMNIHTEMKNRLKSIL